MRDEFELSRREFGWFTAEKHIALFEVDNQIANWATLIEPIANESK